MKNRYMVAGGGAPEIELSLRLQAYARSLSGMDSYCVQVGEEGSSSWQCTRGSK